MFSHLEQFNSNVFVNIRNYFPNASFASMVDFLRKEKSRKTIFMIFRPNPSRWLGNQEKWFSFWIKSQFCQWHWKRRGRERRNCLHFDKLTGQSCVTGSGFELHWHVLLIFFHSALFLNVLFHKFSQPTSGKVLTTFTCVYKYKSNFKAVVFFYTFFCFPHLFLHIFIAFISIDHLGWFTNWWSNYFI